MGALSECDGGGESASRAKGIWRRDGKAERPTKFAMVKAFIGESQKRDRFRSDEACSRSLSSIVHNEVFIFRKDRREVEVKRPRCCEDRR